MFFCLHAQHAQGWLRSGRYRPVGCSCGAAHLSGSGCISRHISADRKRGGRGREKNQMKNKNKWRQEQRRKPFHIRCKSSRCSPFNSPPATLCDRGKKRKEKKKKIHSRRRYRSRRMWLQTLHQLVGPRCVEVEVEKEQLHGYHTHAHTRTHTHSRLPTRSGRNLRTNVGRR